MGKFICNHPTGVYFDKQVWRYGEPYTGSREDVADHKYFKLIGEKTSEGKAAPTKKDKLLTKANEMYKKDKEAVEAYLAGVDKPLDKLTISQLEELVGEAE